MEVSLRHSAPVRTAVDATRAPIRMEDLAAKLQAELPAAAPTMVTELVARPALITSLHAPSTAPDARGHLLEQTAGTRSSTTIIHIRRLTGLAQVLVRLPLRLAEAARPGQR